MTSERKTTDLVDYGLLSYLLSGAAVNDALLQSYRAHHLTFQAIFLAIGTGLVIAAISFDGLTETVLAVVLLAFFTVVSIFTLIRIRRVILDRGLIVDSWQRELLQAERASLGANGFYNRFIKNHERSSMSARQIFNRWLFWTLGATWLALLIVGAATVAYRALA